MLVHSLARELTATRSQSCSHCCADSLAPAPTRMSQHRPRNPARRSHRMDAEAEALESCSETLCLRNEATRRHSPRPTSQCQSLFAGPYLHATRLQTRVFRRCAVGFVVGCSVICLSGFVSSWARFPQISRWSRLGLGDACRSLQIFRPASSRESLWPCS